MHPALISAIAATKRQDTIARTAQAHQAAQARQARRAGQPQPGPRHPARPSHGPAGRRRLAVPRAR
jgi:hypothetical protein